MGLIEAATDEQIRRQFKVNVFGLIRMTKAMLPHFRSNQEGLLINISSMGGRVTFPTMSLYHASKFAVEGFSESVSYELASQNIKVKLIEPGAINTDFGGRSMEFFFNDALTDYKPFTTAFRVNWLRWKNTRHTLHLQKLLPKQYTKRPQTVQVNSDMSLEKMQRCSFI